MKQPPATLEEYIEQTDPRVQVYVRGPQVLDKAGKERLAKELAGEIDLYCRLIFEAAQSKQRRGKHAIPENWVVWKRSIDRVLRARDCTAAAILPDVDKVLLRWLDRLDKKECVLCTKVRDYEDDYGEIDWKSRGIDNPPQWW